jgi:hypothetical protein
MVVNDLQSEGQVHFAHKLCDDLFRPKNRQLRLKDKRSARLIVNEQTSNGTVIRKVLQLFGLKIRPSPRSEQAVSVYRPAHSTGPNSEVPSSA